MRTGPALLLTPLAIKTHLCGSDRCPITDGRGRALLLLRRRGLAALLLLAGPRGLGGRGRLRGHHLLHLTVFCPWSKHWHGLWPRQARIGAMERRPIDTVGGAQQVGSGYVPYVARKSADVCQWSGFPEIRHPVAAPL